VDILAADLSHLLHGRGVTLSAHTAETASGLLADNFLPAAFWPTFALISAVPHVHPHRFRHHTTRRLVEHVDLPTVAALLGDSRLDAVRIYAQPDEATLERAAESLTRA
jgi:integrase